MPTQNVNLTSELDLFVKKAVESGAFNNASEVHRAALQAMAHDNEERQLRVIRLRQEIQLGLASGPLGEIRDLDVFIEECTDEMLRDSQAKSGDNGN